MNKIIVISGCSGGGKSTLLAELESLGYSVSPEVGRQIVKEQLAINGSITPWQNPLQFCEELIVRSIQAYEQSINLKNVKDGLVFHDRSIIDGLSYFYTLKYNETEKYADLIRKYPLYPIVFMTPPWLEIYVQDAERQHSFSDAVNEYNRLIEIYANCGYQIKIIHKGTIEERLLFIKNEANNSTIG